MAVMTDQELFWKGDFGDAYVDRNCDTRLVAANVAFFANILRHTQRVDSVLELGANIGLNLIALRQLLPNVNLSAVEINAKAAAELHGALPDVDLHRMSIMEFSPSSAWDFVFTKGVLIHVNPDQLPEVYEKMYTSTRRYILVAEYYNPTPTEVAYRGTHGTLFKRDFAGDLLTAYPDLVLLEYGFVYRRAGNFAQDDMNWFLLEKRVG